jgi:hypothetical protein
MPEIDTEAQCVDLVGTVQRILGHMPGSLAEHGNMFT